MLYKTIIAALGEIYFSNLLTAVLTVSRPTLISTQASGEIFPFFLEGKLICSYCSFISPNIQVRWDRKCEWRRERHMASVFSSFTPPSGFHITFTDYQETCLWYFTSEISHKKFYLSNPSGTQAPALLIRTWTHCQENQDSGDRIIRPTRHLSFSLH